MTMTSITSCIWFDSNADEAAKFYVSVFPNAKITSTRRYPEAGKEVHGKKPGSVMTVELELNGQQFLLLNGGPIFKPSEAISFMVPCKDQAEIDSCFSKLSADPKSEQCGWLKDKFGISWQIVPADMDAIMESGNREAAFAAMMDMKKIDIAALKAAAAQKKAA